MGVSMFNVNAKKLAHLLLVPIIAIFTKFDRLVNDIRISGNFPGLDGKALQERVYSEAQARLSELCFMPFREQMVKMTRKIPEIAVSSECDS